MRRESQLNITSITVGSVVSFLIFILGWINVFEPIRGSVVTLTDKSLIGIREDMQKFENFFVVFNKISDVQEENAELRNRVQELESEITQKQNQIDNIAFVIENNLIEFDTNRPLIPARIISYDRDQSGRAFINKGNTESIQKDDVVVIGNFVVGEVVEVFQNYSEIKLVATSNYRVNVVSLETKTRGILEGTLGGDIKVVDILTDDPVNVDDVFVTEGQDGKYPYGLYVGKVDQVIGTPAEPTKTVILENSLNFIALDRIYIMKLK